MTLKGKAVVAYLQGPREQFWGILRSLETSGALIEGVEADHFETWARQVARDGENAPSASLVFFPATRLERLLLDRSSGAVPSLESRFRGITGQSLAAYLGRSRPVKPVPFPNSRRD